MLGGLVCAAMAGERAPERATLPPIVYVARRPFAPDHHNTGTEFAAGDVSCHNVRPGAAIRRLDGTNVTTLLDTPRGVIRDLEVSWDARRLLFALRREAWENFAIWEMNADGSGLHRVTDGAGADIDPCYLPDGRIVFSSTRDAKFCGCNWHLQGNLFRVDADGSHLRQLGRNNLYESRPSILPDGRVIYDRWNYVDRHFGCSFGLWTMFPDGRTQALFYGENAWRPGAIFDARALPGGHPERVVCIFGSCHDRPWGALVALDRRKGLDGMAPVLKSFPADITNRVLYTANYGDGRMPYHPCESFIDSFTSLPVKYADPYPLDADRVLVARTVDLKKSERTALYLCSFATGEERLIAEERNLACFDPQPLVPRARPPVLPDAVDDTRKTGVFYLADVYHGTGMERVKRGTIKWLRIVEAPPKRDRSDQFWNTDTTHRPAVNYNCTNTKRVLGVVPVAADGSAIFEVEAGKFVFFQALDEKGMMVQSMRNGTTLQPGEHASCTGCHEDRLEAPPPVKDTAARGRRPDLPRLPAGECVHSFSYCHEIQPIWNRRCLGCHDLPAEGREPTAAQRAIVLAGDLGIVFNTSYMALRAKIPFRWYPPKEGMPKELLKPVDDGPPEVLPAYAWGSHASRLVDMLDAGHHGVRLEARERAKIVEWIDLNTPYYPTYETAFPDRPYGRSPLTNAEAAELAKLTGNRGDILAKSMWARPDETRALGTGVNFTRPELSPCLKGVTGANRERALALIRAGAAALRELGRPDLVEGPTGRRETELRRLAPKEGPLERAREIRYDLVFARRVVGVDLVAPQGGLPKAVDVFADGGVPMAKGVTLPHVDAGGVFTLGVRGTLTKTLTIRIPGAEGGIAAVRVRVPSFAGHLLLRESAATGPQRKQMAPSSQWGTYLDAPKDYARFARSLKRTAVYDCGAFRVEEYRQTNGPGTCQRVQMAVPKAGTGPFPAVVTPFYFPEAMLGFNPRDGSGVGGPDIPDVDLAVYKGISFMADLARRGYVTISADAYHLTYARADAPADAWQKWRHVGTALVRDWPGWTGIGKLAFDTRLLLDVLEADSRVDASRIGMMGHSLGGKMAFYAGCLDRRVKVVVASDFGLGWDQTNWRDVWYWGKRLAAVRQAGLDHADLLKAMSGRGFLLIAGKYDNRESRRLMEAAAGGELPESNWKFLDHATGHRPPAAALEEGYLFLDRWLKPES